MKINTYRLVDDLIHRGIDGGWNKAHKYSDNPSEDILKEQIHHYIMLEISEYFDFIQEEHGK